MRSAIDNTQLSIPTPYPIVKGIPHRRQIDHRVFDEVWSPKEPLERGCKARSTEPRERERRYELFLCARTVRADPSTPAPRKGEALGAGSMIAAAARRHVDHGVIPCFFPPVTSPKSMECVRLGLSARTNPFRNRYPTEAQMPALGSWNLPAKGTWVAN